MLQQLTIRNIALIEEMDLEMKRGLHVLSGETGAGKSLIIQAINMVLGERTNKDTIRTGRTKASVEATFHITDHPHIVEVFAQHEIEPDDDGDVVLFRELSVSGKNVCRANGVLIPLSDLKALGDALVDVHGQHEHQTLLHVRAHLTLLDSFLAPQTAPVKEKLAQAYQAYHNAKKELLMGFTSEQERERRMDVLQFQMQEIDDAQLIPDEEETLQSTLKKMVNAQDILKALQQSHALLTGADERSALAMVDEAQRLIGAIADFGGEYSEAFTRLQEAYYALEDVAFTLRDLKNAFEFDPELLESVQSRLDLIHTLKRKYGNSIADILKYRADLEKEAETLSNMEQRKAELEEICTRQAELYGTLAQQLSAIRRAGAEKLEEQVMGELWQLGLQKARFAAEITAIPGEVPSPNGVDAVEFLFSANAGEPLKPLKNVASGGEISRVMLAIKATVADSDDVPTLIFDEVDSGVSGKVAAAVGQKLYQIARTHQVLCITHLPQVAAMADVHFFVQKQEIDGKTYSMAQPLDFEGRCREVARIMGTTQEDSKGMEHARELVAQADALKK